MTTPAGVRAWLGATLSVAGFPVARGKLYSLRNTDNEKDTKVFRVCPKCKASRLSALNCCVAGCVPGPNDPDAGLPGFTAGNIPDRGRMEGDQMIVMTEEEIAAAKESKLDKGVLDFVRCDAAEVNSQTWSAGGAWWFEPEKATSGFSLLADKIADPDWAYIGLVNLRGDEKFIRLASHNGGIVLEELLRPGDLRTYQIDSVPSSDKEQKMFDALMGAVTEDFDPDAFNADKVAALRALIASKTPGDVAATVAPTAKAKAAPAALEDQLAAALAVAQAARAAKAS